MRINRAANDHVLDYVDDLLHDVLQDDDAAWVEQHCQRCSICQAALEQARKRFDALQSLPVTEASEKLIHRALENVELRGSRREVAWKLVRRSALAALAASVLLIGGMNFHYYRLQPTPHDLRILGQTRLIPGSQASLRVAVYDARSNQPLTNVDADMRLRDRSSGETVVLAQFRIGDAGAATPRFQLPPWNDGDYELIVSAQGADFQESLVSNLQLRRAWKLMLSTDKPVYQPGQLIHLRAMSLLRPDLKPMAGRACEFQVADPQGNIIFRQRELTSAFGIAACDCRLATEIREGAYSIKCRIDNTQSERSVEVQKYVLPKFGVKLQLDKPFYQPGETIKGVLRADYFFGKPTADAEVQLEFRGRDAESYRIDLLEGKTNAAGEWPFQFQVPRQLAGRPQDADAARVELIAVVTDPAGQEYSTKTSRVVTDSPLQIEVIPESGRLVNGVSNRIYVYVSYADGRGAKARLIVHGLDRELETNDLGVASFDYTPRQDRVRLTLKAIDSEGLASRPRNVQLECGRASGDYLVRTDRAVYDGGASMSLFCLGSGTEPIFVDFIKDQQTLMTHQVEMVDGEGRLDLDLPPEIFGTVSIVAHRFDADGRGVRKSRTVFVRQANELQITTSFDRPQYRPGETAKLRLALKDPQGNPVIGAISLAAVDEAVFSVLGEATGMEKVFFLLENELLEPVYAIYNWDPRMRWTVAEADRAEFEQALFSRTAEGADSSVNYTLSAFSYAAKENAVALQRRVGLHRVAVAWKCFLAFWTLFAVAVFAVALPRAFLITMGAGAALMLILIPLLVAAMFLSYAAPRSIRDWATGADGSVKSSPRMENAMPTAMPTEGDAAESALRVRQLFPETLLWQPELITDDKGEYTLDVELADSITTWRVSASAISAAGQLGAEQIPLRVFQPFFVDLDLPAAVTRRDQIDVPVVVYNYLDKPQTVELTAPSADWFRWIEGEDNPQDPLVKTLTLGPGEVRSVRFPIQIEQVGTHAFQVQARAGELTDAVQRTLEVMPNGVKVEQISSGVLSPSIERRWQVPEQFVPGSVKGFVKLYPSSFSQLVEGLDAIFHMPHGCFEQTSSTTYPNVLALDYLRKTKKNSPEVEAKARQYIHLGYQRLTSFEVPGGGFDWFGRPPANLTLTAYGLMEFQDMSRVHEVDPRLIERTRSWLLAQRRADGGWNNDAGMLNDGLARSVQHGDDLDLATTAYVAMAVFGSQAGSGDWQATLDFLLAHPARSIDNPYLLAIMANAIASIDAKHPALASYLDRLESLKQTSDDGKSIWWSMPANERTTFYGRGQSGNVETTAMATLALFKANGKAATIRGALRWIAEQKDAEGTWHSTQATVLALKALTEGASGVAGQEEPRRIEILLDNNVIRDLEISPQQVDVVQLIDITYALPAGEHSLVVRENSDTVTGYQTIFRYHTEDLAAAETASAVEEEPLSVQIRYDRQRLAVNDLLIAECIVTNRSERAAPMVILDLPIPAGFSLNAGELDELQGDKLIDKYQLTPLKAILYLRGLDPHAERKLRYRLKATTPVKVTVPPAEVYQYYDPSQRGRDPGATLEVTS